jgi:hypothetical protein
MGGYSGGCLCGHIRYRSSGRPSRPHFCSCRMCQRASGAPIVAWVDFQRATLVFDGPGGEPALYRSSEKAQRGFCPQCGGAICSLDDGSDKICMTVATLDDPDAIVPVSQSFPDSAPAWLKIRVAAPARRQARKKAR